MKERVRRGRGTTKTEPTELHRPSLDARHAVRRTLRSTYGIHNNRTIRQSRRPALPRGFAASPPVPQQALGNRKVGVRRIEDRQIVAFLACINLFFHSCQNVEDMHCVLFFNLVLSCPALLLPR